MQDDVLVSWHKASGDERRAQILAAARRVAARDGLARLTLRAVATEAELSHGLVLFHFGTKDVLLSQLLESILAWLTARSGGTGDAPGLWDVVRHEVAAADREHTTVLMDFWVLGSREPAWQERIRDAVAAYEAGLAGHVGDDVADSQSLARLAVAIVFGTALRSLLGGEGEPDPAEAVRALDVLGES